MMGKGKRMRFHWDGCVGGWRWVDGRGWMDGYSWPDVDYARLRGTCSLIPDRWTPARGRVDRARSIAIGLYMNDCSALY